MLISLDEDQVVLLDAVAAGRVHTDPRFTKPDFEREPDRPGLRRATQRLQPLRDYRLVELNPDVEPDRYGVRPYRLTDLGERVHAEISERQAAENTDPDSAAPAGAAASTE